MAKRDFDAFYYGVGMKLDEKSVEQAGQQIEGKLNQVVNNVKNNLKSISDAVNKGVRDIDTKGLVTALVEAQKELGNFNDFNPKELKGQIDLLKTEFSGLKSTLGDVADSIKGFKDLGGFISDVATRLSAIEIVAPKMGKDAFKRDVKEIAGIAELAKQSLTNGLTIPDEVIQSLDRKLAKLQQGFRSIEQSGNSLTLFTDGGLAKDLVQLVDMLKSVGKPVEGVLDGVMELTSKMKSSFRSNGIAEFTKNVSYQIEEFNYELRKSLKELDEYERKLAALPKKAEGLAVLKGSDDGKLLEQFDKAGNAEKALDAIIAKIKEYRNEVKNLTGDDQISMYRDLVALTQAAEKRIRDSKSKTLNEKWSSSFSGDEELDKAQIDARASKSGEKLSTLLVERYHSALASARKEIQDQMNEIKGDISYYQEEIDLLLGDVSKNTKAPKPGRPQGSTNQTKPKKQTTDVSQITGEKFTVSPELKINANQWAQYINNILKEISDPQSGKLKPVNIRIHTQGAQLEKDLKQIWKAIHDTLNGTRSAKKTDTQDNPISSYETAFDASFNSFMTKLKGAKRQLIEFIDAEWKPKLKDAFNFEMKVDGKQKEDAMNQVASFVTSYINALNDVLRDKPVELKSNVDSLIEEIKSKTKDIKIEGGQVDFKVGNVQMPQQTIGNLMLAVDTGNLAKDDTVNKIYNLLAVRKGDGATPYDARIAELRSEIEAAERRAVTIVETKVATEQRGAEAVERKVEAESQTKPLEPPKPPSPPKITEPPKPAEVPKPTEEKPAKTDGKFDKQQIYDEVHQEIKGELAKFSDVGKALEWVKNKVREYGESLDPAKEGTEEYFKAQAGVTTLLHQWRSKISPTTKDSPWRYEKWVGFQGGGINWSRYLKEQGIKELLPKGFELSKETAFREAMGLKTPSTSKRQTSGATKQDAQTAEEMIALSFEETKKIAQSILRYAKWAKALDGIADGLDYTITEADFKNRDIVSRNGVAWTKQDLEDRGGMIFSRGKRANDMALEEWIAAYEDSKDEEFKGLFELLKDVIRKYQANQSQLNNLLNELNGSNVASDYNDAPDKAKYLGAEIKNAYARLTSEGAKSKIPLASVLSQYGLSDVFKDIGVEQTAEGVLKTLQNGISNIDFNKLINDLSLVGNDLDNSYKEFVNLLRITKGFMDTSNALTAVGQEAGNWMRGSRDPQMHYRRVYNRATGRVETTNEQIGIKNDVIESGLRQYIEDFKAIFFDAAGNRAFGFNEGKTVVDQFLSGKAPFDEIINFLERALAIATDIQTPSNKGMTRGYTNVRHHENLGDLRNEVLEYEPGIKKSTEAEDIARSIKILQAKKQNEELSLQNLRSEMQNTVSEVENVNKILELSTQKNEKSHAITAQQRKVESILQNIQALEGQLKNPAESFESIVTQLLGKQEALLELKRQYDEMPKNSPSEQMASEALKEQIKKEDGEILRLQNRAREAQRDYQNRVALDLIDQQSLKIEELERILNEKTSNDDISNKRSQLSELTKSREDILKIIEAKRRERDAIKPQLDAKQQSSIEKYKEQLAEADESYKRATDEIALLKSRGVSDDDVQLMEFVKQQENATKRRELLLKYIKEIQDQPKGEYTQEQKNARQRIDDEIRPLLEQTKAILAEENELTKEIATYDKEIKFLTDTIELKKKYVESLRSGLSSKKMMATPEELEAQLGAKRQELERAREEENRLRNEYITLQGSEDNVIKKELELLRARKAEKEARIKEIDATSGAANNEALQTERKALENDVAQIDKHINEGLVETIKRIVDTMRAVDQALMDTNAALGNQESKLNEANGTLATYTKGGRVVTSEDAAAWLPLAREKLKRVESEFTKVHDAYNIDRARSVNDLGIRNFNGEITNEEYEKIKKSLVNINELSDKFVKGKITEEEYTNRVTEAYILMQKAAGEVNEDLAKAQADRIVNLAKSQQGLKLDIQYLEEIVKLNGGSVGTTVPKPASRTEGSRQANEVAERARQEENRTTQTKEQTGEGKKQLDLAQQRTAEERKRTDASRNNSDIILGANGKDSSELWKAFRLMTQEVAAGNRVFREYGFNMQGKQVTDVARGLYSTTGMGMKSSDDTHGHFHPRNTLYSKADIAAIAKRREVNSNYNNDYLFTPDFVHSLTGLKNVSEDAIKALYERWTSLDNTSMDINIRKAIQESWLSQFAQQNSGVQYIKKSINADGSTTDITSSVVVFEKDIEEKILQWGQTKKNIAEMARKHLTKTDEYKELIQREQEQFKELTQNSQFQSIAPSRAAMSANKHITEEQHKKARSATLIQEAVDYDLNLSLFIKQFQQLFKSMSTLGEAIPDGSPLAKVADYIKKIETADASQRQSLIEEMTPYVLEVFKKNANAMLDIQDQTEAKLLRDASKDSPYKQEIEKQIQAQLGTSRAPVFKDDEPSVVPTSIEALKAELSNLLAMRDAHLADPRFATVDKQQEIIEILKSGVKFGGKSAGENANGDAGENSAPTKKKRAPGIPQIGKVTVQSEKIKELTDINSEWDIYKNYQAAKEQLTQAIKEAKTAQASGSFTQEDADRIKALRQQVLGFGNDLIKTSEKFSELKARSEDATSGIKMGIANVREDMLSMVHDRAVATQSLISDIGFDDAKQRMTAVLTDMSGQTTRITMDYLEKFDMIVTKTDKTTDSVRGVYKAIESEMTKMAEAQNLVDDKIGKSELKNTEEYKNYSDAYAKMFEAANNVRQKGTLATQAEKEELISLRKQVEVARMEFEKLATASANFDAKVGQNPTVAMNSYETLETQMRNYVLNSQQWSAAQRRMIEETWKFNNAQNSASYSVEKNKGQMSSMTVIADMGAKKIGEYTVETKKYQSGMEKFMGSLKNKWKEVARYLMTFGSMYRMIATIKQGINYVKEIDTALTELKKVTDETEESYERFLNTASKTANKVGSTIKEVVSSAADWARIGYSMEEAAKLAENTAILLNVSEFKSIDEATSALTSTLQAFSYTAEQSMEVVDVLNEVGNNFAISSDGIATALKDSASSLVAANNSYEEAVALIASANRVVQDPNSVGAALRTISLRLRGTSTKELEEAGEDTTGVVESKSKLRTKIQGYTGVDILTDTGAYKSTYEILLEISKVWDKLTDQDQAGLLELIAGKTRSNTAAAILSNTKDLEEALRAAEDAEGSALRENEEYMKSIQGRIDLFNNAVQTMWKNALESDFIKGMTDFLTTIVKVVDQVGLLKSLFIAIGGILIQKSFKGDLFGGLSSPKTFEAAKLGLQSLRTEYEKAQKAFDDNHTSANERYLNKTKVKYDQYNRNFAPLIKEHDQLTVKSQELTTTLNGLQTQRQSLVNDLSNSQAYEDFLGTRMAAGYDGAAEALDKAHANSVNLSGQIKELDKQIVNTKTAITENEKALRNVEVRAQKAGMAGATAGQKIAAGFKKAVQSIWQYTQQIVASMITMYVITTVIEWFVKLGHAIEDAFDKMHDTPEELQEKFDELNNELSEVESRLKDLEGELDSTNERIEELMDAGTLTFVEQEELNKLRDVSAELERQIQLQETLQKSKQQGVNAASIKTTDAYLNTSFGSEKTKTERQEEAKEIGTTIGQVVGTVLGAVLIAGGVLGEGITFGASSGLIALGASMFAGGMVGGAIGSGVEGAVYDSEQKVSEALDNMVEMRKKLKEEQDTALSEGDTKAYNEATEALRTYDDQMSTHISYIQQQYNAMDWENASTADRERMQAYADWLDKYSIEMDTTGSNGAKASAIARIFGDEATGDIAIARDEIERLKKNLSEANESGKGVDDALSDLENFKLDLSSKDVERLHRMGIYLYEVEDYFKNIVETESEFTEGDLEDVAKDIDKISDGLGSLKSAFEEVIEGGVLTAKTVMNLKEELELSKYSDVEGVTDAWREYLDVMMSGAATTEEMTAATEQLAQAIIEAALAENDLTPDNKGEYIAQLRSLGITNAEEYVDDFLQKNMVKEIEDNLSFNLDDYSRVDEVKKHYLETGGNLGYWNQFTGEDIQKLAEEYGIVNDLNDEAKAEIIERYGVEASQVDGIIKKLAEKKDLEFEILQQQKEIDDYNYWMNKSGNYRQLKETLEGFKTIKEAYESFSEDEKNFIESDYYSNEDGTMTHSPTGKVISIYEYTDLLEENQRYQKWLSENQAEFDAYQAAKDAFDKIVSEGQSLGYVNEDGTLNVNAPIEWQTNYDHLQSQLEEVEGYIDEQLTSEVELQIELQNKSELVDDVQNVFDTLADAQKEYSENGYISVDTLQSLLQLEPKYLDLLVDEEGNLNLTKDALYNVARARITDMGIQSQKNILEQATALASKGSADALRDEISVMETANEVGVDFVEVEMAKIRAILAERVAVGDLTQEEANAFVDGITNQIEAVQVATQSALDNLSNSLSSSDNTVSSATNDAFDKLMDYWDNRIDANQAKYEQIQNDIDWLESQGKIVDEGYYRDQIDLLTKGEESKEELLKAKLQGAADRLAELESQGKKGSDEWWDAAQIYNDTLSKLDDVRDTVLDLQDAIGEIEWSKFDEFNSRLDDLHDKLETIRDLIAPNGEEDWFDDEGNWTEKGVAVLGSYIQDLNDFKAGLTQASNALDKFNEKSSYEGNEQWYADNYGIHSEQEYYDYLQKLTDEQYKYAKSVSDTEQDIAGMWESQVDAVEEYMNTLVEAYGDYIDNVKEALDAERDLYDFKKNVQKQTKDIASLERRIASLSGSTNAADIAERRKLEAELYESRESLNDEYNDHAKQSQQDALDAESQAYEEAMTRFVENLRENLDLALQDMDTFIEGVTSAVTVNAPTILGVYESLGIALDSAIVDPWQAAIDAMGEDGYSGEEGLGLMNSWVAKGGVFDTFATDATNYLTSIWDDKNVDPGNAFSNAVGNVVVGIVSNIESNVEKAKGYLNDLYSIKDASENYAGDNGGGDGSNGGNTQKTYHTTATLKVGSYTLTATKSGSTKNEAETAARQEIAKQYEQMHDRRGVSEEQYTKSWNKTYKDQIKYDTSYYAKGTTGTTRDEWAITDELGPELILHADPTTGRLQYLTKGSGVVPHDATAELMKLADIGVDGLMMPKFDSGINMMTNYITKPEFKIDIEEFVHVDRVDQDTLPKLEAMMDKKINDFSRALNYSIKKFAR